MTRDPDVPCSNPRVGKKKISHWSNQNNTSTNLSAPELNTWNCQRWKQEVTMVQCWSAGLEIHRSPVQTPVWEKENLSQVQSEQYHHQSLCMRVEYLILSEVKTRSCHGAVVACRTRDPEIPSSKPGVAKKKIFHRSNQNNTTIIPSTPELNTWNCQRWKPKVGMLQLLSAGLDIQRFPVLTPVWAKKNLSQVKSELSHHQSLCTRVEYLILSVVKTGSCHSAVVECRTRDPEIPSSNPGVPLPQS